MIMYSQKFYSLVPQEQLFCLKAATHEAGHALAGYFVGWPIDNIRLEINGQNLLERGATLYFKGDDEKIIRAVLDYATHPEKYDALTNDEKENIPNIIDKRMAVLISGPAAEVRFYNKRDFIFPDLPDSENDYIVFCRLRDFLKLFPQYSGDGIGSAIETANLVFKHPKIQLIVSALHEALLQKEDFYLAQDDIKQILDSNGFGQILEAIEAGNQI